MLEFGGIVRTAMQFDGEPGAPGEVSGDPYAVRIFLRLFVIPAQAGIREVARNPQHTHARTESLGIGTGQVILALGTAPAAGRDQLPDVGVTVVVRGQNDE